MVVTAIAKKMKITEVNLGEKIHGISYHKMLDIFECVLRGFTETYKCYPMRLKKQDISYKALEIKNNKWQYLEPFKEKYSDHLEYRS